MRIRGRILAWSSLVLFFAPSLAAQVTLERRGTAIPTALTPLVVLESVVLDPMTRQANLGTVGINYSLFNVNSVWNLPGTVEVQAITKLVLYSSTWIPGQYHMRLEIRSLPIPAQLVRFWYVGTTRQEAVCALQAVSPAVCEHTFSIESPNQTVWFELRSYNANHNFQAPLGQLTVSRLGTSR